MLLGGFYDRAIAAIRAAEAAADGGSPTSRSSSRRCSPGPCAVPGPLPGFTTDANLVYAPHLYNESISPLPGTIEDGFANAATAAAGYGTHVLLGEWGWFGDPAADQAADRALRRRRGRAPGRRHVVAVGAGVR